MRKSALLTLSLAAALAGCTDEPTAPGAPREASKNTEFETVAMGPTEQYWRSEHELWVYDNQTELGYNNHFPRFELYQTSINQIRWGSARMMRMDIDWTHADPQGYGAYPATNCADCPALHTYLDNIRDNVERALRTSVVPVVVVHGAPTVHRHYGPHNNWQGATDAELAETRREFTRFMRDMVALMPGVTFWQILNEVDAGHWGVDVLGGGAFRGVGNNLFSFDRAAQARNYALLMQSVYPAIKQANPNAWVIMSGLTGTPYMDYQSIPVDVENWEFLRTFYQAGGGRYVDIMAIHAYGRPTGDPQGFTDKGASVLGVMNQFGDGKRPLWLTEFGRGAGGYIREQQGAPIHNPGPTFDQDQSNYFASAVHHLQYGYRFQKALVYNTSATDVDAPQGYALPQDGSCGNYLLGGPKQNCEPNDYGVGLFRNDLVTARPAYHTIANHGINHNWLFGGYGYGDVTVYAPYKRPVGYGYTRNGVYVTVHGVHLNKLYPKPIHFEYDPNGGPNDPGCGTQVYC